MPLLDTGGHHIPEPLDLVVNLFERVRDFCSLDVLARDEDVKLLRLVFQFAQSVPYGDQNEQGDCPCEAENDVKDELC